MNVMELNEAELCAAMEYNEEKRKQLAACFGPQTINGMHQRLVVSLFVPFSGGYAD
jgi:hypothetical protein